MGHTNKAGFTFTKPQLTRLFEVINNPKLSIATFLGRVIGLRIEEVSRLKWQNIDTKSRVVTILDSKWKHRKRDGYGKDRLVRLPEIAVGPIERWRSIIGGGMWFLPSDKSPDVHLSKKTLHGQFSHFMRLAGLDDAHFEFRRRHKRRGQWEQETVKRRKLTFHSLRAYWVVDCRKRGIPIEIIAEQAGHEDINTTKGYARYTDEERNSILDRAYSRLYPAFGAEQDVEAKLNQLSAARQDQLPANLKPIEFLQMQLLKGEISEQAYLDRIRLLRLE